MVLKRPFNLLILCEKNHTFVILRVLSSFKHYKNTFINYKYHTNMEKTTYIYALTDGDTIRYIGKSDDPKTRKTRHINESKKDKSNTHKSNWIKKMINEGKDIGLKIIEEVNYAEWEDREKYWIEFYGLDNLTNSTSGGLGNFNQDGISNRKFPDALVRNKNLKITENTHKILKEYCQENGLKMFAFVEKLIKESCKKPTDIYGE